NCPLSQKYTIPFGQLLRGNPSNTLKPWGDAKPSGPWECIPKLAVNAKSPIKAPGFPAKTKADKITPHKTTLNHLPFMLIYYKELVDA
ncbi:hypothetical protein, partial [Endozoicomonas sp. YOMI1]|uniref:hypothetical protein n=1 Tax=Endozoicomonas sp. YOMI1 TaxID=2828739 RepID=UPI0021494D1F